VPVDRLREKFEDIVRQSPLWDGKVARLEVTDVAIDAVELRALVSARNPGQTWDLRCQVREKLVAFIQALPREAADGPARREVTTGGNEVAGPAQLQRPDQSAPSPVASSAMR
jgi:hypothetical protein